jgi:hypothetical protein
VFRDSSCPDETVVRSRVTYYRCGSTWYTRAYEGEEVVYLPSASP